MTLISRQKKILLVTGLIIVSIVFFGIKFHKTKQVPVNLEIWGILDNSQTFLPIINNFQKQYQTLFRDCQIRLLLFLYFILSLPLSDPKFLDKQTTECNQNQ